LSGAGFVPGSIDTKAAVTLEAGTISLIELETEVDAPGLSDEQFQALALDAKANCPVSKVLQAAEIRLKAVLIS
jgi:osmotically inducible protein OsmC